MRKIAVIGFGQGGATAAIKLAKAGFGVDLFEAKGRGSLGHPWRDDIRADIFDFCALPMPPRDCYCEKGRRLFISPDGQNSLRVPASGPMEEISIDRVALAEYLIELCEQAGVKLCFETPVEHLLLENERIVGIKVGEKELRYDLVIDSSGLRSPFRGEVPAKFGVLSQPAPSDVMQAWRGFFQWKAGTEKPDPPRNLHIRHCGGVGLSWCNVNEQGEVDIFIGRIGALSEAEKDDAIADLLSCHAFFSETPLREGRFAEISLRAPLGGMTADGYCALGDSAFMTMPMMGSGIEASMKAACFLAKVLIEAQNEPYTAAVLWPYQVRYFEELGAKYAFIDLIKRWLLNLNVDWLNWLFGCGAVTNEDMGMVSTDPNNPNKLTAGKILKKAAVMLKKPAIVLNAMRWLTRAARAKRIAAAIPKTYEIGRVQRWQKRYAAALKD